MSYAIQAEDLVKRFGGTTALAGVDLEARPGEVLAVLGPNGAGKTTAFRILATLLEPDEGRAAVGGYDVVRQAHQVRQIIALTGQYAAVDESLTGTENLVLIGRLLGLPRAEARRRAAKTYSGGMRRRLDLAASMVGQPSILYLDEPTTGLDPRGRGDLWRVVRGLVGHGVTVLLTTQYLEEADQLADSIVVIDRGRVAATGAPDQLKAQVGGQILQVSPAREADVGAVVRVVADLSGAVPATTGGMVSAPVSDPGLPPAILQRLTGAGVAVAELTLRKPSLDEVFFTLTGHRAGVDDARAGDGMDDSDRSAA